MDQKWYEAGTRVLVQYYVHHTRVQEYIDIPSSGYYSDEDIIDYHKSLKFGEISVNPSFIREW